MVITHKENNLKLSKGYQEIIIDSEHEVNLNIKAVLVSNIFLRVVKANSLRINYIGYGESEVTLLIWNDTLNDVEFKETYELLENARLKLAYGDLNGAGLLRNTTVNLNGKNADCLVKSAALVKDRKHYFISVRSMVPYTYGDMENYSVVLKGGNYKMEATGKIDKHAYKSSSHQTSRALCLSDQQTAFIQPNLMIDENDVLASHATSVGRIDENQLVYMQSRGLRLNEIMALISFGYLLPIVEMIENDEMKEKLRQSIESKVSEECLM